MPTICRRRPKRSRGLAGLCFSGFACDGAPGSGVWAGWVVINLFGGQEGDGWLSALSVFSVCISVFAGVADYGSALTAGHFWQTPQK
ncbi:hypothetical protein F7R05_25160 [Pseudomonas koreensis]|nr:hypothetical protein F7R05_25160 [Pseudomonas koreensis]